MASTVNTVISSAYRGLALFDALYSNPNTFGSLNSLLGLGPWRPPQWSTIGPSLTLVVPNTTTRQISFPSIPSQVPGFQTTQTVHAPPTIYAFDAVIRAEHAHEMVITQNPVQNGAPMSDHMYRKPARLVIEVKMSESMQSYFPGQWETYGSRSVSAFQTLLQLSISAQLFQVATRLRQYANMAVASIKADDTRETTSGLKAIVEFQEVITPATVTATSSSISFSGVSSSARPQTTDSTISGVTLPQSVPAALTAQHSVTSALASTFRSVPGAGNWSSANISLLS